MEISGHKTESVYRRYDIVSQSDSVATKETLESTRKKDVTHCGIRTKRDNRNMTESQVVENLGWVMGLEPMTSGITIRRSTD